MCTVTHVLLLLLLLEDDDGLDVLGSMEHGASMCKSWRIAERGLLLRQHQLRS